MANDVSLDSGTTDGRKLDKGKPRTDLLAPSWLLGVAQVLTMGAEKYNEDDKASSANWRKGMRWGRVYAGMQRHLNAFWDGQDFDDESGLHHLLHASFGCMVLYIYGQLHPELDDRPAKVGRR